MFWEGYVSDEEMGTFAPIVVYWLYAGFFQLLPPLDNYRLHTRAEEDAKNLVPLSSVIKAVLLQQLVHATVSHLLFLVCSFIRLKVKFNLCLLLCLYLVTSHWMVLCHK